MSDPLSIAASGLEAASTILTVSASNLANLNTPGYAAREVELAESPGGSGVTIVDIVAVTLPVESMAGGRAFSGIDPVAEAINYRKAESLYTANAAVIAASQQMFGNLVNMLDTEQDAPPDEDSDNVL